MYGVRAVFFLSVLAVGAIEPSIVLAQQTGSEPVLRQKLKVLEARLDYLERRLKNFERHAADEAANKRKESKTDAGNLKKDAVAPPQTTSPVDIKTANDSGAARNNRNAEELSVPQEAFIFRDLAPTLKKGHWEFSQEFNYTRSNGFLQWDRIAQTASIFRYGVSDRFEVSVNLPAYYSQRTSANIFGDTREEVKSLGDISIGASYALFDHRPSLPGVALSGGVIIPMGTNPYSFAGTFVPGQGSFDYVAGENPIDTQKAVLSRGHYGVRGNIVAYKVVDPLIIYASPGLEYYFPRTFQGFRVEPALRYTFSTGFNFALSEKTTLGMEVRGFYSPDFKVDSVQVPRSYQEQYFMRMVLTQRVLEQFYIEPSVTFGLTKESPDVTLGLALRYRSQ